MSTISREELVSLIDQRIKHTKDARKRHTSQFVDGMEDGYARIRSDVLLMPSAQQEIIQCKDCKHWTNNIGDSELRDNYCNEKAHGFYYRCSGDDYCSFAER